MTEQERRAVIVETLIIAACELRKLAAHRPEAASLVYEDAAKHLEMLAKPVFYVPLDKQT